MAGCKTLYRNATQRDSFGKSYRAAQNGWLREFACHDPKARPCKPVYHAGGEVTGSFYRDNLYAL